MELTLLEFLSYRMGCNYLSDLRFLNAWQYERLAREVEQISPKSIPIQEWNDALNYLVGGSSIHTPEDAKEKLIALLPLKEYF